MEGFIISYKENLLSSEITNINYFLFGKVLIKNKKKYYYNGLLANTYYFKLGNGCYFIKPDIPTLIPEILSNTNLLCFKCMIELKEDFLKTAKETKRLKHKGDFVKNL